LCINSMDGDENEFVSLDGPGGGSLPLLLLLGARASRLGLATLLSIGDVMDALSISGTGVQYSLRARLDRKKAYWAEKMTCVNGIL
jgi:hypothetical protein